MGTGVASACRGGPIVIVQIHTDNYIDAFSPSNGSSLQNRVTAVRLATTFAGGMLAEEAVQ